MAVRPEVQAFADAMKAQNAQQLESINGIEQDNEREKVLIAQLQADNSAAWTPENQAALDEIQQLNKATGDRLKAMDESRQSVPQVPPVE